MPSRCLVLVGWMLVCAVSVVGWAAPPLADVILYNGRVVTMVAEDDTYEAIAVAGNRILAMGTDEEILGMAGAETKVIDLNGNAVYPGFIDAHAHLLNDSESAGLSPTQALDLALQNGITTAGNMVTPPDILESAIQLANRGELRVRSSLYLIYNTSCGDVLGDWYAEYAPLVEIAPRLWIGGVKIFSESSVCDDALTGISFSPAVAARPCCLT